MENRCPPDSDPFEDPISVEEQSDYGEDSTLVAGRNASLTLGTDSLIVLGTQLQLLETIEKVTNR